MPKLPRPKPEELINDSLLGFLESLDRLADLIHGWGSFERKSPRMDALSMTKFLHHLELVRVLRDLSRRRIHAQPGDAKCVRAEQLRRGDIKQRLAVCGLPQFPRTVRFVSSRMALIARSSEGFQEFHFFGWNCGCYHPMEIREMRKRCPPVGLTWNSISKFQLAQNAHLCIPRHTARLDVINNAFYTHSPSDCLPSVA